MRTLWILVAALAFSLAGMAVHEVSSSAGAPVELAKKNRKKGNNNRIRTKTTKIESKGLSKENQLGSGNTAKKMQDLVNKGVGKLPGIANQTHGQAAAAAALEAMKKKKSGLKGSPR